MDLNETARLLTFIAGVDPRMAVSDRDAQIRQQSWQRMLRDVDAVQAANFTERYYRAAPQWSIQAGDIYQGCKPNPHWKDKAEHQALAGRPMPAEVRDILGRDPLTRAARRVPCRWSACNAGVGQPCNLPSGRMHPSRIDDAAVSA